MQNPNESAAMKAAIQVCHEFAVMWAQQAMGGDRSGASDHKEAAAREIIEELRKVNAAQTAVVLDGERAALLADYVELNMSNYGPDDVDRLNAWAIEAYGFIARAASPQPVAQARRALNLGPAMTPFGMLVRALRIVAGTTLYDMAKHLSCTSAMLSAVEFGRQPVTDAMVADASAYFSGRGIPDTLHALKAAAQPASGASND